MNADEIERLEEARLRAQAERDAARTPAERNRLGQFATPTTLARGILAQAARLLPDGGPVSFLDPALGTGAFYAALLWTLPKERIRRAVGFEIDPRYGEPARALWSPTGLEVRLADFTRAAPGEPCNLLICNPPYVRHHHVASEEKVRLRARAALASGVRLDGLAGLYGYFLLLAHAWLAEGGLAGWLVPSEFMDVNYGRELKRYLLDRVTLLRIHRFDPTDVQFGDALVSSAVLWFRKAPPPPGHAVELTFGGSLSAPETSRSVPADALRAETKWTRFPAEDVRPRTAVPGVSDFFAIKRGIATGGNRYFILSEDEAAARRLPAKALTPILPGPRHLPDDIVEAHADGTPRLARRLFLVDCRLPPDEVARRFPTLWAYYEEGRASGRHEAYLCRHRSPWYAQERRPPAPFVCTYLGRRVAGRAKPFRFILNRSRATAANVYLLLYPKPDLARALAAAPGLTDAVWQELDRLAPAAMLGEGRVYGGGLHKLEPRELANVPAPGIAALLGKLGEPLTRRPELLDETVRAGAR